MWVIQSEPAQPVAAAGRCGHRYCLVLSPAWAASFKHLLLKQGGRDGWCGWLISSTKLVTILAKYAFLQEKEHASHDAERRP